MTTADTSDRALPDAGPDVNGPTVHGCTSGMFDFHDRFSLGLRPQFWTVTYAPTS